MHHLQLARIKFRQPYLPVYLNYWLNEVNKINIPSASGLKFRQLCTSSIAKSICRSKPDYGPVEVRRTSLLNGITVAAAKPMGAVIASCTVMFQVTYIISVLIHSIHKIDRIVVLLGVPT